MTLKNVGREWFGARGAGPGRPTVVPEEHLRSRVLTEVQCELLAVGPVPRHQKGGDGYSDEEAEDAEQGAKYQEREQNEQGMQAHLMAQDVEFF